MFILGQIIFVGYAFVAGNFSSVTIEVPSQLPGGTTQPYGVLKQMACTSLQVPTLRVANSVDVHGGPVQILKILVTRDAVVLQFLVSLESKVQEALGA